MNFEKLELKNFRNFDSLTLQLSPSINMFLGCNGQGKTNLLESIYMLTHGESFRPGPGDTFVRQGDKNLSRSAFVRGKVRIKNLQSDIEMRFENSAKRVFVDNKKSVQSRLTAQFPTILFSPDRLLAIKQGPESRRILIDQLLVQHNQRNKQIIVDYIRVLRTRNRLLKDHLSKKIASDELVKILESLNPSFLNIATELVLARIESLQAITPKFEDAMRFLNDSKSIETSIEYLVSEECANSWNRAKIFDSLQKRAIALAKAEMASGSTLVGPHKHDIRILFNGRDSRYYSSQGQQRALILSFKMAQIVYHHEVYQCYPVLLLDDVMSELDVEKRSRLVEFLETVQAQILITATDLDFSINLNRDKIKVFHIESGRVSLA